jgi:predicted enzyme related to lactoylglutathione lyase
LDRVTKLQLPAQAAVEGLAPFVHVADVERSLGFYEQLGLVRMNSMADAGRTFWGSMRNGQAHIMFAQADSTIDDGVQGVLFYFYSADVAALRGHLLACGVRDAGKMNGPMKAEPKGVLFGITYPEYMPAGELRVHDPDGYCLLIGQRK